MELSFTCIIIIVIISLQIKCYISTKEKILSLRSFFNNIEEINKYRDCKENIIAIVINYCKFSKEFEDVLKATEQYLEKNQNSVGDFHLMKNIVDRKCEMLEDEIDSRLPLTLYLGLAGTMLCIIISVVFSYDDIIDLINGYGAGNSIGTILLGTGLAMMSSAFGIIMTSILTFKNSKTKSECDKKKNIYLTWLQTELLPTVSNDISSVINKMTENLNAFNYQFSNNIEKFDNFMTNITETTVNQVKLIESIEHLNIRNIAIANIEVYDKLKNCTNQLEIFGEYLKSNNNYIDRINKLTEEIGNVQERTKMIEEMAYFFKEERGNIDQINKQLEKVDNVFIDNSDRLINDVTSFNEKIQLQLTKEYNKFTEFAENQQNSLQEKTSEFSTLVKELKNIGSLKESILQFNKAISEQNKKIEKINESVIEIKNSKKAKPIKVTSNKNNKQTPKDANGESNKKLYKKVFNWILSIKTLSTKKGKKQT